MVDFDSKAGQRVLQRLQTDEVIWLTTVDGHGGPQPRPVWFHWDGKSVLIFSQLAAAKLRHIRENPAVALNFNTDQYGGDVGVITGEAQVASGKIQDQRMQEYLRKYERAIKDIGMTPEQLQAEYSVPLLVTPKSVRGF